MGNDFPLTCSMEVIVPEFKEVAFNTDLQRESIKLREEVLRKPLGLKFSQGELNTEDTQVHLIGEIHQKVCAVLLLYPIQDGVWKMRQVAVSPQFQGHGIGQQLVKFSERWLSNQGARRVELHARLAAVNFYLKLNYHTDDVLFEEVGLPHKKMWKDFVMASGN